MHPLSLRANSSRRCSAVRTRPGVACALAFDTGKPVMSVRNSMEIRALNSHGLLARRLEGRTLYR